MANIYYMFDSEGSCHFTNDPSAGYTLYPGFSYDFYDKLFIIELYNDKFTLPSNSNSLFKGALNTEFDTSKWDTSQCTDMSELFESCCNLTSLDLRSFDTSNVTDMHEMFYSCSKATYLDVSSFNTSKVTNMATMFGCCGELLEINIDHFDVSKVTALNLMFLDCKKLKYIDLNSGVTSANTTLANMFYGCKSLEGVDIYNFDASKVTNGSQMFYDDSNLEHIGIKPDTDGSKYVGPSTDMFLSCIKLPNYSSNYLGKQKAYTRSGGYFEVSPRRYLRKCTIGLKI